MYISDNGVEIHGIDMSIPPIGEYFKEFDFQVNKKLDDGYAIEKILSTSVSIKVGETDIIKTPIMISNEGVYFSGHKLKVELVIGMKMKYMLKSQLKAIDFINDKVLKTIYIVLPLEHNNENTIDLLRRKKILIEPYVEDIYCSLKELNVIYTNISAVVVANFIDF